MCYINPMGKREENKIKRRNLIVTNALQLFQQKGFGNVTTAEIAAASHIAKKTFFQYFPTKDDVIFDNENELLDRILELINQHPKNVWEAYSKLLITTTNNDDRETIMVGHPFDLPQLIVQTPSLRSRLLVMWANYESQITDCLLATGDQPSVLAAQLLAAKMVVVLRLAFQQNQPVKDIIAELNG